MPLLRLSTSLFAVVVLVAIAGCGDSETETVTVTTEAEAAEGAAEESADAEAGEEDTAALEEAVDSLRAEVTDKDPGQPGTDAPAGFSASPCGSGVYVKASTTSCAFALNVARDFFATPGYRFYSYSPTTGETYLVRCSRTYPALCRAGSARIVIT